MRGCRREIAGVELPRQLEEGQRVLAEVGQVEDRLRAGEVVLLQVVVKSSPRRPKIGNAGSDGDAGAAEDHHAARSAGG